MQRPADDVTEDCFVSFVIHKGYLSIKNLVKI